MTDRIRAHLPQMPDVMAKIATLTLKNPTLPLELSITELAERAGTSAATVTRFCRLIGYSGYVAFRVSIAEDVGRGGAQESWDADFGRSFGPDDPPDQVMRVLLNAHTMSLRTTAGLIDLEQLKRVAAKIGSSRHLDIYGTGGSTTIAAELGARLYRIGVNSHVWTDVHSGLTSASILDPECVALGISNTGRTEETLQMLGTAKTTGAHVIAMTSSPESPLARLSDDHLTTASPDSYLQPDDLAARHAQLFVTDLIYLLVAQYDFERTAHRLAATAAAVAPHLRTDRATHKDRSPGAATSTPEGTDQR